MIGLLYFPTNFFSMLWSPSLAFKCRRTRIAPLVQLADNVWKHTVYIREPVASIRSISRVLSIGDTPCNPIFSGNNDAPIYSNESLCRKFQSFLKFRYLLGPIILLALSDALFHHPLYPPRQWQLFPMLPYSSILHVLFNNQPLYNEYAEDHLIQRGNVRPSYLFLRNRSK